MIVRVFSFLLLLLIVFASARAMIRWLPGDPLETLMAESGTTASREVLRSELGLNRPYGEALFQDLKNGFHGDFGHSLFTRQPLAPELAKRFKKTMLLAFTALGLGLFFSLGLGLLAARTLYDSTLVTRAANQICTLHGALAAAMPTPWLGPILIDLFAVKIKIFPLGDALALPSLTLALGLSGFWSRLIRERVRESLKFGSAQGARARGIPEWKVMIKYGLAPVSGSLLAYLGTQIGALLGGAFLVEVIFDWPGMGSLLVDSVLRRDYPVVEMTVFLGAAVSLAGTALGDWAQTWIESKKSPYGGGGVL